jgi:hypothetical protein
MWPFKKKKKAVVNPGNPGFNSGMPERKTPPHHYVLAHLALRDACFYNPTGFFGVMASENKDLFLADIWKRVRETCDPDGMPNFDISDLEVTTCRVNDHPGILVKMPPPAEITEAYFVGIVLKVDVEAEQWPANPEVEYLTLEKGASLQGGQRTVFCGWAPDGDDFTHYNMGSGPAATEEDFAQAMADKVR